MASPFLGCEEEPAVAGSRFRVLVDELRCGLASLGYGFPVGFRAGANLLPGHLADVAMDSVITGNQGLKLALDVFLSGFGVFACAVGIGELADECGFARRGSAQLPVVRRKDGRDNFAVGAGDRRWRLRLDVVAPELARLIFERGLKFGV